MEMQRVGEGDKDAMWEGERDSWVRKEGHGRKREGQVHRKISWGSKPRYPH